MDKKSRLRKSWQEKLADSKGLPKVQKITGKMSRRWGTGTVVIPAPKEVDEMMRKVLEGKLIINEIRKAFTAKHNAFIGCPLTTGIFAWVVTHATEEQRQQGEKVITPYWRTLKAVGLKIRSIPGKLRN